MSSRAVVLPGMVIPGEATAPQRGVAQVLTERSPIMVFVFSVVTLGIYSVYWYSCVYTEWKNLTGETPTGNEFGMDLIFSIVTCGIWAIYVDYRISQELASFRTARGLPPKDTTLVVLILDLAAYITVAVTFLISTAIQQQLINELRGLDRS